MLVSVPSAEQTEELPAEVSAQTVPQSDGVVGAVAALSAMGQLHDTTAHSNVVEVRESAQLLTTWGFGLRRKLRVTATAVPLMIVDTFSLLFTYLTAALIVAVVAGGGLGAGDAQQFSHLTMMYLLVGTFGGIFPGTGVNPVKLLRSQSFSLLIASALLLWTKYFAAMLSLSALAVVGLTTAGAMVVLPVLNSIVRRKLARYSWWGERTIIIGADSQAKAIFEYLNDNQFLGLRPLGVVATSPNEYWNGDFANDVEFLGSTDDLPTIARKHHCQWGILSVCDLSEQQRRRVLNVAGLLPNLVVVEDQQGVPNLWGASFDAAGFRGTHVQDRIQYPMIRVAKRAFDIVAASLLLIAVSPLWIAIAALVCVFSPGTILFGHDRMGRGGKVFKALKFRTMVVDADVALEDYLRSDAAIREEWEQNQKLAKDPRIIPVAGDFLRSWSLDEIPQLWNVLVGDMSLVGPRPIMLSEVEKYGSLLSVYSQVRPGLTGLWQVSGRNKTTYAARLQLNAYYLKNWSLWLDFYVLLRTIRAVVTREGSC